MAYYVRKEQLVEVYEYQHGLEDSYDCKSTFCPFNRACEKGEDCDGFIPYLNSDFGKQYIKKDDLIERNGDKKRIISKEEFERDYVKMDRVIFDPIWFGQN
jgi:hypothetical protein